MSVFSGAAWKQAFSQFKTIGSSVKNFFKPLTNRFDVYKKTLQSADLLYDMNWTSEGILRSGSAMGPIKRGAKATIKAPFKAAKWGASQGMKGLRASPWGYGLAFGAIGMASGGISAVSNRISGETHQQIAASTKGTGYITWSKNSGMPQNNLSTDGLSLALSDMRHSSIM